MTSAPNTSLFVLARRAAPPALDPIVDQRQLFEHMARVTDERFPSLAEEFELPVDWMVETPSVSLMTTRQGIRAALHILSRNNPTRYERLVVRMLFHVQASIYVKGEHTHWHTAEAANRIKRFLRSLKARRFVRLCETPPRDGVVTSYHALRKKWDERNVEAFVHSL